MDMSNFSKAQYTNIGLKIITLFDEISRLEVTSAFYVDENLT